MAGLRLAPIAPAPHLPTIVLTPGQSKTVGRGRQADVMVDDPSLSRLHARVTIDRDGQLAVDDLGSTNGIFVNGSEQLSAFVLVGDVIRFGRVEYIVSTDDVGTSPGIPDVASASSSQTVLRRVAISSV